MRGGGYRSKGALNRKEFHPINGEFLLMWRFYFYPFKSRYSHTNSPDKSPYWKISWENLIKNKLTHFNKNEHFINAQNILTMLEENWCCRSKGLTVRDLAAWYWQTEIFTSSISYTAICKYFIFILAPFTYKQKLVLQECIDVRRKLMLVTMTTKRVHCPRVSCFVLTNWNVHV